MKRIAPTVFAVLCFASVAQAKDYQLYLLAGQSNMDGHGYVEELPDGYFTQDSDVMIFHGNSTGDDKARDGRGIWSELKPGHGTNFSSNGKTNDLSNRFGPELGFAKILHTQNPDTPIAIVKYSRGGTALDGLSTRNGGKWNPEYKNGEGINQYDHCLATIRNAFAVRDIDGDGKEDRLVPAGIVWMQGESDAHELGPATRYAENLATMMNLFRAALRVDDLPVVIGRISDSGRDDDGLVWDFGNVLRAQQEASCQSDANAKLVTSTDNYSYSDKWHYDSAGFIDLGEQFAKAMHELRSSR